VHTHQNLLGGPPPTLLPDDAVARDALAAGTDPAAVAAGHPALSLPWAVLAEQALAAHGATVTDSAVTGSMGDAVQAYAYARVGYHRGLDALRGSGWKGHGPVPWSHGPNQGFLRALAALGRAAAAIGETAEHRRCTTFLADCDPAAAVELGG
jgi:Protein of unknown function (DUF3151)